VCSELHAACNDFHNNDLAARLARQACGTAVADRTYRGGSMFDRWQLYLGASLVMLVGLAVVVVRAGF
jgi:hypothetical protein